MTRYLAPVSLPTLAAVFELTRPDEPRSCSWSTEPSLARSTIRNFSVDASSFVSMLARSFPTPPYHQPADVSFVNSATPTDGFPDLSEAHAEVLTRALGTTTRQMSIKRTMLHREFISSSSDLVREPGEMYVRLAASASDLDYGAAGSICTPAIRPAPSKTTLNVAGERSKAAVRSI